MFQTANLDHAFEGIERSTATPAQQIADLISRYPSLTDVELARLINLYPRLSALDMALLISDETLGPKVDGFHANHRSQVRVPFSQYAVLVGIGIFGLVAIIWSVLLVQ